MLKNPKVKKYDRHFVKSLFLNRMQLVPPKRMQICDAS